MAAYPTGSDRVPDFLQGSPAGVPFSPYTPRTVTVRGGPLGVRTFNLPEEQDDYEEYLQELESQGVEKDVVAEDASTPANFNDEYSAALEDLGFDASGTPTMSVRQLLEGAGVDPDHPDLQQAISLLEQEMAGNDSAALQAKVAQFAAMAAMNPEYAMPAATMYDEAVTAGGFTADFPGSKIRPQGARGSLQKGVGGAIGEAISGVAGAIQEATSPVGPKFEQGEGGFVRHRNGTIITPEGQVVYDPTSTAPGSLPWQRQVVSTWSADKVLEWKKRLADFGYLPKEAAKKATVDQNFLGALSAYHASRYVYGKPVAADDGSAGSTAAERPDPVNLKDLGAQIRNNVREEYRRIYGTDPSDGEVATWANYIMRMGMDLQKKFIRRYDSPNTSTAVTEATERFVEKLEGSPEAEFLRESDEENTRLRDTFERMAVVTNSLVS